MCVLKYCMMHVYVLKYYMMCVCVKVPHDACICVYVCNVYVQYVVWTVDQSTVWCGYAHVQVKNKVETHLSFSNRSVVKVLGTKELTNAHSTLLSTRSSILWNQSLHFNRSLGDMMTLKWKKSKCTLPNLPPMLAAAPWLYKAIFIK